MTLEKRSARPCLRQGLIIREDSLPNTYVVKDVSTGDFFHVGVQEHYLFSQLDGQRSGADIRESFEARFREPLSAKDFEDFVDLAARRGLLDDPKHPGSPTSKRKSTSPRRNTWLNWRIPFFDPDGILACLEPKIRFVWSSTFLVISAGLIALAAAVAFANRAQWISTFPDAITWNTLVFAWILVFAVTLIHEFAHGLTCKHFGGEVREIGFLLLFFMPCFYCNVSDAWLFRERSKRLWVGAAGGYVDLIIWATGTMVWRVSAPETSVNYFAWMLATVCGGRCFFNCNPLIKLDAYYFLSDAIQIPNLFDRGRSRWMQTVRWILWGGPRPKPEPSGAFILCYGIASWLFIFSLLWGMVFALLQLQSRGYVKLGWVGIIFAALMPVVIGRSLLRGLTGGEFVKMLLKRAGRVVVWLFLLIGLPAAVSFVPIQDRVAGTFSVRPATRIEVNSPEAGFLRDIAVSEGSQVSKGTIIARIDIPDLEVNLTKKLAEISESKANLRRLEAGPRPEEVTEQRHRVERGENWIALGKNDLESAKKVFDQDVLQLQQQILQNEAEIKFGKLALDHAERLHAQKALSGEQLQSERTKFKIAELKLEHSRAQKGAREAEGTVAAAAELAKREKDLADERSKLKLLEAGGRPEEVDAEKARLARLTEEHKYLEHVKSRIVLHSPVSGIVTTPRMHEKNGQYAPTGTVVCIVEDLSEEFAEIAVSEATVLKVEPGQAIDLRARGMPLKTIHSKVDRAAPRAAPANPLNATNVPVVALPGNVTVYCSLSQADAQLLSGMTGYARIYTKKTTVGRFVLDRMIRYLRTELWFW